MAHGPWLALVMINDLTTSQLSSSMWKFADDTTISNVFSNPNACSLQDCVQHVAEWSKTNLFRLNPTKCKEMVICFKKHFPALDPVEVLIRSKFGKSINSQDFGRYLQERS